MCKQYGHLHTMAKTSVKFQNDWPKTVGGVALTRHPLLIVDERTGHGTPISHLRYSGGLFWFHVGRPCLSVHSFFISE